MLNPNSRDFAENIFPHIVITIIFVIAPFLLLGAGFGQFKLAIFVSLPGLLTEALAGISLVRKYATWPQHL